MLEGISVWRGDSTKAPDSMGRESIVGRGAVYGQQEGFVAPEVEDPPGRGRTVAPGVTSLGESGREPPMVVGAEQRVKRAG